MSTDDLVSILSWEDSHVSGNILVGAKGDK